MKSMQCAAGVVAALLLSGCATTTITNLTSSALPRNPGNTYPVEVQFHTAQNTVRKDSITPFVLVGTDVYPMEPVQNVNNRWEAHIPVPTNSYRLYYRYKFNYTYDRIPAPGQSSRLSPTYKLDIAGQ